MGDQIQAANQHDSIQTVTSVGNSWIICRSKSHAGRIYYFNTLSGEAAWNLSDPEIEKAKTRTKFLTSQSGGNFEGCPEPKDPPIDNNLKPPQTSQILMPSRVYNKQIINNQFSKHTLPPIMESQCSKCNSVTCVNSAGVNFTSTHNCNPNVWAIPPHHQIVIAPTTSPILNQLQPPVIGSYNNVEQRVSVQNTSLPLSHRFKNMQKVETPNRNLRFANGIKKRNNNNACYQKTFSSPYHKNNKWFSNSMDLRQKLTARRKSNNAWNNVNDNTTDYQAEEVNRSKHDTQKIEIIKPTIENITPTDADDQWLQENATLQGTQLILDVTPLKQLVTAGSNSTWFIVADINVLLNHINLMKSVVTSDEKCQLMVPDFVMAELQTLSRATNSQLLHKAHNILQTLSQQFTAGNAVMGKDPASGTSIYDFCYRLTAQDHDVVLISNSSHWKSYKVNSIITLCVEELRDMLSKASKPAKRLLAVSKIQITIPNESDTETPALKNTSVGIQFDSNKNEISEGQISSSGNSNKKEYLIHTVDIGIQTDLIPPPDHYSMTMNSLEGNTYQVKNINDRTEEHYTRDEDVTDSTDIPKRREIRLKRHVSHQPATDNNAEKKQFKWRRKRNASVPYTNTADPKTKSYGIDSFNVEDKIKSNKPAAETRRLDNSVDPEYRSASYYPVDSSESSSSCFIQKTIIDDKVVIEETSTSGVISNSADSESMHSIKHNEQVYDKMIYDDKDAYKCVMFEVESQVMEECLRLRSDEWVSRFVQIMEEVLSQVLQQHPIFYNRTLPPPWTIHEATECINKKFEHDSDVQDAATRLSKVLFKISNSTGKISVDVKPSEFMEMYSYGVYLVDALQSVLSNCEDLQTAADSLAKLLSDIKDPALDTSHTDAFMDSSHLPPAEVTELDVRPDQTCSANVNMDKSDNSNSPSLKSPSTKSCTERRKYNLRSNHKKSTEDEPTTEQPVKFIRNIDIEHNFFSSLNLKKNQETTESTNTNAKNCNVGLNSLNSKQNKTSESSNNEKTNESDVQNKSEPKIIRNFSKCLEFEKRLNSKQKENMELDKIDSYTENNDEDDGYDYYDDYSYCDFDFYDMEEETNYMEPYTDNKDEPHLMEKMPVDRIDNIHFKTFILRLVNEIQMTFLDVNSFCAKITEELRVSKKLNVTLSPSRRLEIKSKAEMARSHIDALSKSLNGIFCREAGNCGNKILNVLEEAGIRLDFNKSVEYRNIIEQYPKQADILLDAVNIVLEAIN